jgi:hypothetical protein
MIKPPRKYSRRKNKTISGQLSARFFKITRGTDPYVKKAKKEGKIIQKTPI